MCAKRFELSGGNLECHVAGLNLDQISRLRPLQYHPAHPPFREPNDRAYRHWSHLRLKWGCLRYHLFKLSLNLPHQGSGWLQLGCESLPTNLVDRFIQAPSCCS